jgi:hypothetical protein
MQIANINNGNANGNMVEGRLISLNNSTDEDLESKFDQENLKESVLEESPTSSNIFK